MDIQLNRNSSTPLYLQLKNHIKSQILSSQLTKGLKLPSERQLAQKLQIHRNTVVKAYEALIQEGLIFASRKTPRGYFVGSEADENAFQQLGKNRPFSSLDKNLNYHFTSMQNTFQELYNSSYMTPAIPFAGMIMDPDSLPITYLKELMAEIIENQSMEPFWHCDPQGTERLRRSLVKMLFGRNIYVHPNNIQIVTETFEALSNIAYMYLEKGDYVIVEEPTCPAIVNIFLHAGANLLFVPMEPDGISIEILEQMIQRYHPKLIYTIPNSHNPSSITMSIEKRQKFLDCVLSYHIPIVEEDAQNEYNYTDTVLPSLYSMDHTNSVIYIDSSTLAFFPGARVGYIVAPDNVIKTYRRIINKDQIFLNSLGQYLWARFIETGYYDKHKQFLKEFYRKRRDLICRKLAEIPEISFHIPDGGLNLWVKLEEGINDRLLVSVAEKMGLLLMPGCAFFPCGSKGETFLRICFSAPNEQQIEEGVEILKRAIAYCKNQRSL